MPWIFKIRPTPSLTWCQAATISNFPIVEWMKPSLRETNSPPPGHPNAIPFFRLLDIGALAPSPPTRPLYIAPGPFPGASRLTKPYYYGLPTVSGDRVSLSQSQDGTLPLRISVYMLILHNFEYYTIQNYPTGMELFHVYSWNIVILSHYLRDNNNIIVTLLWWNIIYNCV